MKFRRRRIDSGSGGSMGGQLLGLSMFVMLLAFFIVLNAISTFSQSKVDSAVSSLDGAFSSTPPRFSGIVPSITQNPASDISAGNSLERIRNLFASHIPAYKADMDEAKDAMHVRLPLDDFERAVQAVGREGEDLQEEERKLLKEFFLPALVALVKNNTVQSPYRMEIRVNSVEDPAFAMKEKIDEFETLRKRLVMMAEQIEAAGLPEKNMSIGLRKGEPDTVDLYFGPYVSYSPAGADRGQ